MNLKLYRARVAKLGMPVIQNWYVAEIRRRNVYRSVDLSTSGNNANDVVEDDHEWEPFLLSPLTGFVLLLMWSTAIFMIGLYFNEKLPTTDSDVLTKFDFKTDNVLQDLKILASFGPKVTGSHANEYEAVNFLRDRILDIKNHGGSANEISYDLQTVSGKFPLTVFSNTYVFTYENIQNIIVKVGPRGMSNYSLLINCHFDSVPTSPGASDDGLNCAVMLEMIRVLSFSPKKLPHNIIFLFNGAEENPLMGSHGFITEHKWAHEIKAFINLESCGAGGREILFQAGPNHPWLIKVYGEAAKYPHGIVVAEEIFQSGLIPSDTDFRIFRDFGHIPGLDFAHFKNGYVYHTKFDNIESIESPHGVIKHTGENILSLSKALLNSKEFINPSSYQSGKQIYFDLFGLVFISYSDDFGTSLNIITLFISLLGIGLTISMLNSGNILEVVVKFLMTLLSLLTFLIVAVCYNLFIAFTIDFFGYSLSWFTNKALLLLIYGIPMIFMMVINTIVVDKGIMRNVEFNAKIQLSCLSIQLLWTLFLFASFFLNVRSSFLLMIIVLPCALWTLITVLQRRGNRKLWHALFILISSFSSCLICYFGISCLKLFIPITGRIGVNKNPEFIISLLTSLLSVAAFSYVTTLFIHVKKQWVVLKIMLGLHLMSFLFVISPLGFPFSFETPQRILVTHVNRQFFNSQLSTEYSDSLFWIQSMERRGWNLIPFLREAQRLDEFCEKNGYCGLPWFSKVRERTGSTCISSASHGFKIDETKLEIISKELIGKEFNLEFQISGSDHMGLIITPLENVTLLGWNLPSEITQTSNIVSFVQGMNNSTQKIVLEALKESPDSVIKIEVYSLYFHHEKYYSTDFHKFLKKFPKWSDIVPSLAVYKSYVF